MNAMNIETFCYGKTHFRADKSIHKVRMERYGRPMTYRGCVIATDGAIIASRKANETESRMYQPVSKDDEKLRQYVDEMLDIDALEFSVPEEIKPVFTNGGELAVVVDRIVCISSEYFLSTCIRHSLIYFLSNIRLIVANHCANGHDWRFMVTGRIVEDVSKLPDRDEFTEDEEEPCQLETH